MMVAGLVPAEGRLAVVAPCRPSLCPENFHVVKPSWIATEFSPRRALVVFRAVALRSVVSCVERADHEGCGCFCCVRNGGVGVKSVGTHRDEISGCFGREM